MASTLKAPGGICTTLEHFFNPNVTDVFWWKLHNGTIVYCNGNVTAISPCFIKFDPDSDIAGWGVIISFVAAAWYTVFVASLHASHQVLKIIRKFYEDNKKWLPDILNGPLNFFNFRRTHRLEVKSRRLLDALCDLQLITGTGIVISGLSQYNTISYYHEELIIDYWWLTLTAFWSTREGHGNDEGEIMDPKDKKWASRRALIRVVVIWLSVVLFAIFQVRVELRESYHWDPWEGGRCYISHDPASRGTASRGIVWLCEAGIMLQAVCHVMMLRKKTNDMLHGWFEGLNELNGSLRLLCVDQLHVLRQRWKDVRAPPVNAGESAAPLTDRILRLTGSTTLLLALSIWWLLGWSFTQWISVWAYGLGFYPFEVFFYIFFATWNTYDILDLKLSNRILLTEPETRWGFGQVLPVVLLASIGFNFYDALRPSGLPT